MTEITNKQKLATVGYVEAILRKLQDWMPFKRKNGGILQDSRDANGEQTLQTTNMDADAYILVVQKGRNYRMSIKEAIAANVDIKDVVNTVETQSDKIVELTTTTETHAEQIDKLENIVQNINKDVAVEEDADATFDNIFTY